jgi:hypothetical protein
MKKFESFSHCVIIFTILITIAAMIPFPISFLSPPIVEGKIVSSLEVNSTELNPIVVWNDLTTNIGEKEKLPAPELTRVYALVHVSMYDSLLTSSLSYQNRNDIENPAAASAAGAASAILSSLFPNYNDQINRLKETYVKGKSITTTDSMHNDSKTIRERSDYGEMVGEQIAKFAPYQISNSGSDPTSSDLPFNNTISSGPCIWNGTNPVLPKAGTWKTYILTSGTEVQPVKPLLCGSEEDLKELEEVYRARMSVTPEQIRAAHYWGDRLPPVIWNEILNERIIKNNMSIFEAAYASAYLNVGMYDGFVSCWYTKYDYWTARPFQRIANFTTVIPTPNFPSYTSGHSIISAVASKVLGELFHNEKNYFEDQATEAALSRFWSGIHFKQDIIVGFDQGTKIGNKIIGDMHKPFHPFVYEQATILGSK